MDKIRDRFWSKTNNMVPRPSNGFQIELDKPKFEAMLAFVLTFRLTCFHFKDDELNIAYTFFLNKSMIVVVMSYF